MLLLRYAVIVLCCYCAMLHKVVASLLPSLPLLCLTYLRVP